MKPVLLLFGASSLVAAKTPMSSRMLDGIMARKQGIISSGAATSTLESGILADRKSVV